MTSPHNLLFETANSIINLLGGTRFQLDRSELSRKIRNLYEKGKEHQWNATERLTALQDKPQEYHDDYGMTLEAQQAFARVLSQFYYGERGAQVISSQLVTMVEDKEAAQFLSTQVMDEARHVEVMEKMILHLDKLYPINPFLNLLLTDMTSTPNFHEKIIGMNLLVEGLALSMFQVSVDAMEKDENLTDIFRARFQEPLESIIRDEARHVGFGTTYIPGHMKKLSVRRKAEIKVRQLVWMTLEYCSVKYQQKDSELLGYDHMEVVKRVLAEHQERVEGTKDDTLLGTKTIQQILPYADRLVDSLLGGYERINGSVEMLLKPLYATARTIVG